MGGCDRSVLAVGLVQIAPTGFIMPKAATIMVAALKARVVEIASCTDIVRMMPGVLLKAFVPISMTLALFDEKESVIDVG